VGGGACADALSVGRVPGVGQRVAELDHLRLGELLEQAIEVSEIAEKLARWSIGITSGRNLMRLYRST
jgi:hypothetical protein